jgi:hypothetical protein
MKLSARPDLLVPLPPRESPERGAGAPPSSRGGASFREILAETLGGAADSERALRASLSSIKARRSGPEDLIVLQAAVYRAARDFELLSKVVDKSAGAVKQALQSNQG